MNKEVLFASGASAANAAQTVSVAPGKTFRILWVSVNRSGAGSGGALNLGIDSHLGATFDIAVLATVAAAAEQFWQPSGDLILNKDDEFDAAVEAGGSGITTHCVVAYELF
jgi:hypothetical protein